MKFINFIRHITRIVISGFIGFIVVNKIHFDSFGNILMFMALYIGISFILEPFFRFWEKKYRKKNNINVK